MSYQVLARKYRPKGFDTLVGQEHVVRALSHALDSGRLHHAYLFTGTRGVGKTTLSRILAKAFNCHGLDGLGGVTSRPCGACDACVAIDAGRFVDYIEIDAASNRGVEEMAQLLEQAVYAPSNARFKVYMIDEVHMLSNHAFNAMLKTLEEPPPYVKFILATTDPQKIPVTVLSRCLQFNLKQMPPAQIIAHLSDILGQESMAFETPALRLLAQGAHGSMRDALSLTDQAIAYAGGNVTLEAVQGMLGAMDQSFLIRILDALAERDGAALIGLADDMATRSLSYNTALQDIGSLLHRIALAQTIPTAIAEDLPEHADIVRLAGLFDADEVQLFYQIAVHGRNELGLAPDDFAGFSMTLLRMLAFRPGLEVADDGGAPAARPARPVPPISEAASGSLTASLQTVPAPPPEHVSGMGRDSPNAGFRPAPRRASAALAAAAPLAKAVVPSQPAVPNGHAPGVIGPARAALNAARNGGKAPVKASALGGTSADLSAAAGRPGTTGGAAPVMTLVPAPPWEDADIMLTPTDAGDTPESAGGLRGEVVLAPVAPTGSEVMPNQHPNSAPPRSFASQGASSVASAAYAASAPGGLTPAAFAPVAWLDWDGNWPLLAAALPVRGVVQQLAQQSELLKAEQHGENTLLHLVVAIDTLRSTVTVEKLATALTERFSRPIRIETALGPVRYTTNTLLAADRAERQRQAEQTMQSDPFVQTMLREFGATIVPGSVKPI